LGARAKMICDSHRRMGKVECPLFRVGRSLTPKQKGDRHRLQIPLLRGQSASARFSLSLCTANAEHPSFFDDVSQYGRYHLGVVNLFALRANVRRNRLLLRGRHVRTHPPGCSYRRASSARPTSRERVDSGRIGCSEEFFHAIVVIWFGSFLSFVIRHSSFVIGLRAKPALGLCVAALLVRKRRRKTSFAFSFLCFDKKMVEKL